MTVLASEPLVRWSWISGHLGEIGHRTFEHVALTVIAVALGSCIGLPLGVIAHRHRRLYGPVTWMAGLLYTIPSLALFVLLVPVTGLTWTTVEIALVSYTLLILIRNMVAGLDVVPEDVKDAGRGMGLTNRQLLWRVEIPLALPIIVAGIRVTMVSTIGLVTVGALIGAGGLGWFILDGLNPLFPTEILVGAVLSVVLAFAADVALLRAQRALTPWSRATAHGAR